MKDTSVKVNPKIEDMIDKEARKLLLKTGSKTETRNGHYKYPIERKTYIKDPVYTKAELKEKGIEA